MNSEKQAAVIIIGSGLAGYNVAREFRKLDSTSQLVIISADNAEFYSKPMLSNALEKNKSADELAMAKAEKMATDLDATILTQTRVSKIDPELHRITTSDNQTLNYSQLVLATGASPVELSIKGNAADKILHVNDLQGYARFREAIKDRKKIFIIGAGLIGCEFANDLVLSGYEVTVVNRGNLPLDRILPEAAGHYLENALAEQGVNWQLGKQVKQLNHDGQHFVIELDDGTETDADVVLSAIGLKPNTQLAEAAGINVAKGIQADKYLQTSQQDIFALGDCAEVEKLFLPYVMPLMSAARVLAKNLCGEKVAVTYPAMPVIVKTPSCPVVASLPYHEINGEWIIKEDEQGVHATYVDKNGNLQGFALVGKSIEDKLKLTKALPAILN